MTRKTKKTRKEPVGTVTKPVAQQPQSIPKMEAAPIVGIGASAGGLEALEGLFAHMPADINASFVVIQHLDPHHKSLMGELLQPYAPLKVVQIEDGLVPESNCIYINPPNYKVGLMDRTFCLSTADKTQSAGLPIDHFFRTLADDLKERAIAVILSGSGTDGSLGIKAVKGQGGMTMVQDDTQAAYPGMPRSAIDTGQVDLVLPIEKIGPELRKYLHHPYISEAKKMTADGRFDQTLKKILLSIRNITGNDFAGYKPNTIRRRIERRMALHQINRIEDYHRYAEKTPAEVEILFKDLLIGVTNFFRDPEAFKILAEKALPAMVKDRASQAPVRIWVPGCSTGEEAYSMAIIMVEAMEKHKVNLDVQIFATDIDEDAIAYARQGTFPDNISADISKQQLRRFFIKNGNAYTVTKQIRDMIVFATQNLINDPPFSKLDLVSCRNLLIYMKTELQKQILPLFHFTLVGEGILFLGNSESLGGFADLFTPIDTKWKLFKRKEVLLEDMGDYPVPPLVQSSGAFKSLENKALPKVLNSRSIAEQMILEQYAPTSVLINEKSDILFFMGDTSNYLNPPVGEPAINLKQMIRQDLRYKLSMALNKAVRMKKRAATDEIAIKVNDSVEMLRITVTPLAEPGIPPGLMMVVFESRAQPATADDQDKVEKEHKAEEGADLQIKNLEQELKYTRENLQTTIEELETSNEELKSTNEELQSTNEELQSTNEELETSKEEMHSTNEELVTINAELQNKLKELEGVNNDINNLLASTEIATLFLDSNLNIRRFTPAATDSFNLIGSDIGRSIGDITSKIEYDALQGDAEQVLETLIPIEKELLVKRGGGWVSMKMLPYRTFENVIDGVVITFLEITQLKQAEQQLCQIPPPMQDYPEAIAVQDFDGRIVAWNQGAVELYGWRHDQAIEKNIFEMVPGNQQEAYVGLRERLQLGSSVFGFLTQRQTEDGRKIDVCLTAVPLLGEKGRPHSFTTTERKITGQGS